MTRQDLVTATASKLRLRRDDFTRLVRVLVIAVVSVVVVVTISAVPGCGATHALLGIHQAPAVQTAAVPLTLDQAKTIVNRSFAAAHLGETTSGPAGASALRGAYTNQGLRGAGGRVKLASVQPEVPTSALRAQHPKLLAVSRGFGYPRFIIAQTTASDGGLPILHLLVSPDAATPYRISMSVEMVPPAAVQPFDPLSRGSLLVTHSSGLAVDPGALLNSYAAQMVFPAGAKAKTALKPLSAPDAFSGQVRAGAATVAKAVATQATFSQVHKVVPGSVTTVRQSDGGALVFGVIERTDSFVVKKGQSVNTADNKAFVLLSGKKRIATRASITTLEFVVFSVPRSTGSATLVAAREQIVAGSGS